MFHNRIVLVYIVAMVLALPMLFIASPTEGLEIKADQSLANSHASFFGAGVSFFSGRTISEAGDVNGDGFDDFLIGAHMDSYGGTIAAQTYLILGKASGWTMDTNLSNVDASFLGEAAGDYSGSAVSGAGDVNGDGFDDILIGAHRSDQFQDSVGKTYLIMGKATGWSMETNLSDADASFYGEDLWDYSGYAVSGAGDVNGDGFDDFLIGATGNDDGGGDAGQTYLILGRASGWAKNRRLHTANASFWGEDMTDDSGYALSGAGDVNGDGYDDFIIGAYGNGEGVVGAGQTYLIFGKASGWAMDTDLSTANASFWGEDMLDGSGRTVAGAGDVNGDGFDDIIIGAYGDDDGGSYAGQTYLILGKASGWAMDTDLSTADASFRGESMGDYSGFSVAGAGDINGDGYDDIIIGAYGDDDGGADAGQTYLILGKASGWAMDTDLSTADASFWGEVPGAYSGVMVAGAGDVNGDGYDDILIGAHINVMEDPSGSQIYLICFDRAPPEFLEDSTPSQATTGEAFTFTVSVLDRSSVEDVSVEFWFGDSRDHNNSSMALLSGDRFRGIWVLDITIPSDSLEPLHYLVSALDPEGNLNRTVERRVTVTDNDPPMIEPGGNYTSVTTGQTLTLLVNVTDNVGIKDVRFLYWYTFAFTRFYNFSMVPASVDAGGNGIYTIDNITVYQGMDHDLGYYFSAVDTSGNWNYIEPTVVEVLDDDRPELDADRSDTVAFTGSPFEFNVNLTDNIRIGEVYVEYWFGDDTNDTVNVSMEPVPFSEQRTFIATIQVPTGSTEALHYRFTFSDPSNNWNVTGTVSVLVTDNIIPIAVAGEDIRLDVGGTADLDGSASSDNVGILRHFWTFTYDDRDIMWEEASMSWTFELAGVYVVTLSIEDTSNNVGTDTVEVTVVDDHPPVADAGEDIEVDQLTTVTFDGTGSSDNVGLERLKWTFDYDGEPKTLRGPSPTFTFHTAGIYLVRLEVLDVSGHRSEDTVTVTILDTDPPVAAAGNDIALEEGDGLTLDASASTDNVGVVSWRWTITGEGVEETLEGETVAHVFTDEGTYTVTLEVSDARGNSAEDTLVVTIEGSPTIDPPDDEGGVSMAVVVGILFAVVVAVLMMRRRSGAE